MSSVVTVDEPPYNRHGSAISKLIRSDLAMKSPVVHRWLTVYMQGKHTDNEILYGLVVELHSQSESLMSDLMKYISIFGSLPQGAKEHCHADSDEDES